MASGSLSRQNFEKFWITRNYEMWKEHAELWIDDSEIEVIIVFFTYIEYTLFFIRIILYKQKPWFCQKLAS